MLPPRLGTRSQFSGTGGCGHGSTRRSGETASPGHVRRRPRPAMRARAALMPRSWPGCGRRWRRFGSRPRISARPLPLNGRRRQSSLRGFGRTARRWRRPMYLVRQGYGRFVLPWPAARELHLQREAQEGADQDDDAKYCHAGKGGLGGDRADDVPCHAAPGPARWVNRIAAVPAEITAPTMTTTPAASTTSRASWLRGYSPWRLVAARGHRPGCPVSAFAGCRWRPRVMAPRMDLAPSPMITRSATTCPVTTTGFSSGSPWSRPWRDDRPWAGGNHKRRRGGHLNSSGCGRPARR